MRVIDPVKLDSLREMVDSDITQLCFEEEKSRPSAYKQLLENLGLCLHLHGCCGWWNGFVHLLGTPNPIFVPKQVVESKIEVLTEFIESHLTPLKDSPLSGEQAAKTKQHLTRLIDDAKSIRYDMTEKPAKELFRRLVFGVSPDAVATALILEHLQPGLDLWLTGDRFQDFYPKSEWSQLFSFVSPPHGKPTLMDRNQMFLFEELQIANSVAIDCYDAFVREREKHIDAGPLMILNPLCNSDSL